MSTYLPVLVSIDDTLCYSLRKHISILMKINDDVVCPFHPSFIFLSFLSFPFGYTGCHHVRKNKNGEIVPGIYSEYEPFRFLSRPPSPIPFLDPPLGTCLSEQRSLVTRWPREQVSRPSDPRPEGGRTNFPPYWPISPVDLRIGWH